MNKSRRSIPTMTEQSSSAEHHYRIGAVARLTGLSVDRLRAWERRYGVVATRRNESLGRIYTRADVERLSKLKRLVELGNAIGSIAHLSDTQLDDRLQTDENMPAAGRRSTPEPAARRGSDPRLLSVVASGVLTASLLESLDLGAAGLRLRKTFRHSQALFDHLAEEPVSAAVLEMKSLHADDADALLRQASQHASVHFLVVVGFARRDVLDQLRANGITIMRQPVLAEELVDTLSTVTPAASTPSIPSDLPDVLPARRFLDDELMRLSRQASVIECECPEHLSVLISSLNAFEQYSSECKVRMPEEAELHAYLQRVTAHARALMEEGLENLIEIEGLAPDSN
jgi:DNA-binding transcriptional MerR regulator